jgi:hypothetical protein
MMAGQQPDRSNERCPACGAYRLALIDFPDLDASRQTLEHAALGLLEPNVDAPPAIGCLSCGVQWEDLISFRRAQQDAERGAG